MIEKRNTSSRCCLRLWEEPESQAKPKTKTPLCWEKKTTRKEKKNGEDCKAKKKTARSVQRSEEKKQRCEVDTRGKRERDERENTHCDDDEGAAVKRTRTRVESGGRSGRSSFYHGQVYVTSRFGHLHRFSTRPSLTRCLSRTIFSLFWPFLFSFFFFFFLYFSVIIITILRWLCLRFFFLFSFFFFKFCEIEIWRIYPKTVAELLEI